MITTGILFLLTIEYSQSMKGYFSILEELSIGTELFEISKFLKTRIKPEYKFAIIGDRNFADCISIQEKTGITKVKSRIDRETLCHELQDQSNGKCIKFLRLIFISPNRKDGVDLEFEIIDINDNKPFWQSNMVFVTYPESNEKRSIKLATASDNDIGDNAMIKYHLQSINHDNFNFNLENTENRLILIPKVDIDFETKRYFNVTIVAEDRGIPSLSSILIVKVSVVDINDNKPQFVQNVFHPNQEVYETISQHAIILKVLAIDKDSEQNGQITYYIDPSVPQFVKDQFVLDPKTGELKLRKPLDYDRGHKSYKFIVIAKDNAPAPYELSSSATVEIKVIDVNDEIPQIHIYFTTPHLSIHTNGTNFINISENLNSQQFDLAHIQVEDYDDDDKTFVDCVLDNKDSFRLIPDANKVKSFILSATKSFDREQQQTENVRISCRDNGKNENFKNIIINIVDKNDNYPKFLQKFHFNINENSSYRHQDIGRIVAVDKDQGKNAELRYKIIGVQPRSEIKFHLDPISGKIYVDAPLDREEQDHYNLTVIATDQGEPSLTGTGTVLIKVDDINDWPPSFDTNEYRFKISEESLIHTKVGVVHATDRDIGKNALITYHFITDSFSYGYQRTNTLEKFHIKKDTGEITVTSKLDRESRSSYLLIIEAMNSGSPRKYSASTTVHIVVLDYNDNAPRFYSPTNGSLFTIDTDRSIGSEIIQFRASDSDEQRNSNIVYSVVSATDPYLFNLEYSSGILFLGKKIESSRKFRITIRACDTGLPQKCSEDLLIFITTSKPTFLDPEINNNEQSNQKSGITESNGAIIACLIVIFVILVMAMVVMFFLIRNKNLFWKRRMDKHYDKTSVSEIQVRNGDPSFLKKNAGSIYEGDLLLLNERNKANNMMHNSMYSPKIYTESQMSGRADSPCYRTIDVMASSVYNPIAQVPTEINISQISGHPQSNMRYSQHQQYRGVSEPLYRYSNVCGRNTLSPTISVHPSYYQSIATPGTTTIRLNKKSNETADCFNSKNDNSNILINYDARSMPRSISLMKFYEKQNDDNEPLNEKNHNYEAVNRAKYAYEALREGSFI